jgi:hypothetical protein
MARAKNCNIEFDKKLFFMLEEILKDVHNTYLTAFLQIKELINELQVYRRNNEMIFKSNEDFGALLPLKKRGGWRCVSAASIPN